MDKAFDRMLDIINGSDSDEESEAGSPTDDNVENDNYRAELQAMEDEIRRLAPPVERVEVRPEMIEVAEFDAENNVLDLNIRDKFKNECVFEETAIFTRPVNTTNTMEGYLSNVSFHERDLIQELIPDEALVIYRCNYGKLKFDGYTEPVKQRKTNRGRKKKEKKKKLRKKQGDGVDFNSQITFVVRSSLAPDPIDGIIPYESKVYKFKIFRTGKLQLPGVHQHLIDDVIACTKKIAQILNFHLHPGEDNPARLTNIINVNPVMKNYKFLVKLPPGKIINMRALQQILQRERVARFNEANDDVNNDAPEHPSIFMLKYTRQDTKLSIKFSTPIYKKPKKKTRINIFMRGKINILGAFYADVTRQICEYLHWIFEKYYDELVVSEGLTEPVSLPPTWVANIEDISDDETDSAMREWINWIPPLPYISEDEYMIALNFIHATYNEILEGANTYLRDHFADSDFGEYLC